MANASIEPWFNYPGGYNAWVKAGKPGSAPVNSDQQNAYDYLKQLLNSWGIGQLAPDALKLIQEGHNQDAIPGLLQDTAAYKQRFAGNEVRRKNGLAALSPSEYLQTERAYRRIMESNGMPYGFYDNPSDFADWIGKDVAPAEVNERVNYAVSAANRTDEGTKRAFKEYYGIDATHLAAFFLDQSKAMPLLEKQSKAASLGAAAYNNGLKFNRSQAESLTASTLVDSSQYDRALGEVAGMARDAGKLANIYNDTYNADTAASEMFMGNEQARKKREDLANKERASFSGGSGGAKTGLSQDTNSY